MNLEQRSNISTIHHPTWLQIQNESDQYEGNVDDYNVHQQCIQNSIEQNWYL